jgi:hypothetical protein
MDNPTTYQDGTKHWIDAWGKFHRDDGPALEYADGDKSWWQHGKNLSFNNWLDKVDMSDEAKVMMTLKYG